MWNVLAVGAGGFLGAVCRYLIGLIPLQESFVFPTKTLVINVVGCLVIGWIAAVGARHEAFGPHLLLFLKVGLCGGFTTFSTFALETADLMKAGHPVAAILYVVLSVLAGVAAVFMMESLSAS